MYILINGDTRPYLNVWLQRAVRQVLESEADNKSKFLTGVKWARNRVADLRCDERRRVGEEIIFSMISFILFFCSS